MNEAELVAWGEAIGREVARPIFLALRGDLGTGKSVLARAIARGAGVAGALPSPTYNLMFRYEAAGGGTVAHLDLYRLEDPEDVRELGWRELGEGREMVIVEWPERAEALLPPDRWDIELMAVDPSRPVREVRAWRRGEAPALPEPPSVDVGRT